MYLPLFINLRGKKVLVVGFGKVGRRRAEKLQKAGALVTIIDRHAAGRKRDVKFIQKTLSPKNIPSLKDYFLVVTATDDKELNAAIARKARREGVLINRTDNFRSGDVIFPAVIETEGKIISFTTLGKSPRLSKKFKEMLEHGLP